jgi:hypothetical protein
VSVEALRAVFRHSTSTGAARLVLLALADEASDEGEVTAYRRSQNHLARKANAARRTVQRALDDLITSGELEELKAGDGRRQADYLIHLPELGEGRRDDAPGATDRPARGDKAPPPSSRSSRANPDRSARAPANAGAPLPIDLPAAEPPSAEKIAWRLIRGAYDARDRKPIENRQAVAKNVVRLLGAGWMIDELRNALMTAPAWTPSSIQVELTRGRGGPGRPPNHVTDSGPDREAWNVEGAFFNTDQEAR